MQTYAKHPDNENRINWFWKNRKSSGSCDFAPQGFFVGSGYGGGNYGVTARFGIFGGWRATTPPLFTPRNPLPSGGCSRRRPLILSLTSPPSKRFMNTAKRPLDAK